MIISRDRLLTNVEPSRSMTQHLFHNTNQVFSETSIFSKNIDLAKEYLLYCQVKSFLSPRITYFPQAGN